MTDDYLEATRKTVVANVHIMRFMPGDPMFPKAFLEERGAAEGDVWMVSVYSRTGFLPIASSDLRYFLSEAEAQEFAATYPVGSETVEPQKSLFMENPHIRENLPKFIDAGLLGGLGNAGDEESPLAFDVLEEAGINVGINQISETVVEAMDSMRVEHVKRKYGDNWTAAIVFEYCWLHLPHSSAAYLAAAYQFHHYITEDEFAAGYYWRDLECVISGVEAEASKALMMRQKAGAKGSESSARARKKRVEALMVALEEVAKRNPDIAAVLGPKSLLVIAIPEAAAANQSLWAQGQGQAEEYLGEIRRGEAGEGLKSRYHRIFPQKTA